MPLRFLLDEDCRGRLWDAIGDHNRRSHPIIDAIRVGDLPDLPLGSLDPAILVWAEDQGRILVSLDKGTMIGHLQIHLDSGRHSPGVFVIRSRSRLRDLVDVLAYCNEGGQPEEFADGWIFIP